MPKARAARMITAAARYRRLHFKGFNGATIGLAPSALEHWCLPGLEHGLLQLAVRDARLLAEIRSMLEEEAGPMPPERVLSPMPEAEPVSEPPAQHAEGAGPHAALPTHDEPIVAALHEPQRSEGPLCAPISESEEDAEPAKAWEDMSPGGKQTWLLDLALDRKREILAIPLPDDGDDSAEATRLRALILAASDSTINQTIALRSSMLSMADGNRDAAVEQFIEERRQKALAMIAKMRENS
jgi:hypothetical protein